MYYNYLLSLGFIRVVLLVLFLIFINNKITNKTIYTKTFENYIFLFIVYGSSLIVVIYILLLLNVYDSVSSYLILFIFFFLNYFKQKRTTHISSAIKQEKKLIILRLLKDFISNNKSILKLNFKTSKSLTFSFLFLFIISVAVVISRFYLSKYDMYLLSDLWLKNLGSVKGLDYYNWYNSSLSVKGELILISFYKNITGISAELALQSFGIIETVFIGFILFWLASKLNNKNKVISLLGALIFILCITVIPININYIFEHKSIFLSLGLALPAAVYILNPGLIPSKLFGFKYDLILIFSAIALINLFTSLVIVPLLLLCLFILTPKTYNESIYRGVKSYVYATVVVMILHYVMCVASNTDFAYFLQNNFINLTSFTGLEQLIIPLNKIKLIFLFIISFNLIILFQIKRYLKAPFYLQYVFNVFSALILGLSFVGNSWLDQDILNQSVCIFIPIVVTMFIGNINVCLQLFYKSKQNKLILGLFALSSLVSCFFIFNYHIKPEEQPIRETVFEKQLILETYAKIFDTYLPYSYAVVNNNYGKNFSINAHYFMTTKYFKEKYDNQDDLYDEYKSDKKFLDKNPEYILPKTILVFSIESNDPKYNTGNNNILQIEKLICKGRNINLFLENGPLKVYEIVNTPNSSKIIDLMFY